MRLKKAFNFLWRKFQTFQLGKHFVRWISKENIISPFCPISKTKMDYSIIVYWKIHIRPFFFCWCIKHSITASSLLPNLMLHSETSSDRILVYFWIPQRTGSTSFHLYLLPPREMNPFWLGLQKVNLASVFQIFFYGQ